MLTTKRPNRLRGIAVMVAIGAAGSLAISADTTSTAIQNETVERFLNSGQPPLRSYRARRHLQGATKGGSMTAQLDVWTTLAPDGTFTFEVIEESGSDLIRNKVLHPALMEEQRACASGQLADSALSPANYEFALDDLSAEPDLLRIALTPRHKNRSLIQGAAFVKRQDADLVTVEGELVKRPSFWTRKVHVVRRYARIDGVRVPVEMQSRAEVLMVGRSTFSMTYEYSTINGRPVQATPAN